MANRRIGTSPVKRRTLGLNDPDWNELNQLVIDLKLNGVSSVIRAFLRLISTHRSTVMPLLLSLIEDNDRIQPEVKSKTFSRAKKFDIRDVVIGASNNAGIQGNSN